MQLYFRQGHNTLPHCTYLQKKRIELMQLTYHEQTAGRSRLSLSSWPCGKSPINNRKKGQIRTPYTSSLHLPTTADEVVGRIELLTVEMSCGKNHINSQKKDKQSRKVG